MFSIAAGELAIILFLVLLVMVYPAVCIARIANKLGRNGLSYGLLSVVPPMPLVLLGVLAFGGGPPDGIRPPR